MPVNLLLCSVDSPIGQITLALEANNIVICEFADHEARVAKQLGQYYAGAIIKKGDPPAAISGAFKRYFDGDRDALNNLASTPIGTIFEQTVWHALKNIPAGATSSYGAIAKSLGSSPRAVGRANGRNPVCLLYPCHRVIGADGSLTGYAGGLARKEWLLKHEGALLAL